MLSNVAILVRAPDDRVIGWSHGAEQLSGYTADEIVGRSLRALLQPSNDSPSAFVDGDRAVLQRKNGQRVLVTWTRTPVYDAGGILVAFTDVLSPVDAPQVAHEAAGAVTVGLAAPRRGGAGSPPRLGSQAAHVTTAGDAFGLAARADPGTTHPHPQQGEAVLHEGEHTFRQIVEALPLLTWVSLMDGQVVFTSSRWSEYTGRRSDELVGWGWTSVVHPDDRERVLAEWRQGVALARDACFELRLRRHDGAYYWFETRATVVQDPEGRRAKWFGYNNEVHQARLAREALTREREHLERIIAAAPGAFFSYRRGANGEITLPQTSAAIERLLGQPPASLQADVAGLLTIHPDDRARVQASIDASAQSLRPWRSEHRVLTPHRGELWVEGHAVPTIEPDGAIQWFGFLQDISERKRAEESLRTAQGQLMAALEAGGMGTSSWEISQDRMQLHPSLLRLFGRTAPTSEELEGDLLAFVLEDDVPQVRRALDTLRTCKGLVIFEYRVQSPEGDIKWLSGRGRCECDASGKPERAMLLHVDITRQKRATETQLRSQKLEALGTLAGGIAHDFNNMLQALAGNSALALRKLEPEHPARPLLDAISLAGERAADLVRRILQFSRPSELQRDVLSLRSMVSEALKLVRATVPTRIEIREELGIDDPHVEADATQIHQIILNLATNASHAIGGASGFLRVRLEGVDLDTRTPHVPPIPRSGRYAALHVTDSGSGIDAHTLTRIFDPFFTTKPTGEGTGLGLSVVHGIMKSLGGAVTARSVLGEGSTFTLYFPVVPASPTRRPSSTPPARSERTGGRVLFLDDERILVELATHTLESLGYEVLAFERPRDALRAFLAQPDAVDAVITDLAMPELSGFDFAAKVLEVRPELPIVMISGNVGQDELATAQRLGLREVLIKPVAIDVLGRALRKAMRPPAAT